MAKDDFQLRLGKVAIVGTGAVGGYYGGLLANRGEDIHFLLRSDYEVALRVGFTLRRKGETLQFPVQAYDNPVAIGASDWVIITLKSTANSYLPEILKPLVGENTKLLTLQNGFGNVEFLNELYPCNPIFGGLCFVCINRVGPAVFENYLPGYVEMGVGYNGTQDELEPMVDVWTKTISKCRLVEPLQEALWRKLCWNIPFNGLAIAAGGITTDLILANRGLVDRCWRLMREIQLASPHKIPDDFLQLQFDNTSRMGAYRPSSLIDFIAGKAVELEAIWGNPLREGLGRGTEMPELESLYVELKKLVKTT
jgi:2-dehydropantoate 2-reductase